MTRKLVLSLALVVGSVAVAAAVTAKLAGQSGAGGVVVTEGHRDGRMTLRKRAKLEREKGNKHVVVPMSEGDFFGPLNLEQAAAFHTAVVAEAVQVTSKLENDDDSVGSWYRFKVVEVLSEPAPAEHPFTAPAPEELLPIGGDEFVAHLPGGAVSLDGVQVESYMPALPPLTLSRKYLLFVDLDERSRVARLSFGPESVFHVRGNGKLEPLSPGRDRLRRELDSKYGGSLEQFKAGIKAKSARE